MNRLVLMKGPLTDFANAVIKDIQNNMEAVIPSSNLAQSLEANVSENRVQILANDYFQYAEVGRGSGKVPYNFEEILIDWMKRYRIPHEGTDMQFAQAIKWKTIKYGSARHRGAIPKEDYIKTSIEDNYPELEEGLYGTIIKNINDELSF